MLSQNNKNRIAYLGALTLLFSYAEMLLPRFVPFFRFGFGNIAILLALNLNFSSFFILIIIKSLAASLTSGTLFSPFLLISLGQSMGSGILMFILNKVNLRLHEKLVSIFGISIAGAATSSVIQILLSSLYLGRGTTALLGPMLLFSIISGIVTAWLSFYLKIPTEAPQLLRSQKNESKQPAVLLIFLLLAFITLIFYLKSIPVLLVILAITVALQLVTGRSLHILPHISLWCFVLISTLFIPNGKVLFKIGSFSITQGALFDGIIKSLKLSAVSCLSQSATIIKTNKNGFLSLVLAYFKGLSNIFRNTSGSLLEKIKITLSAQKLEE